MITIIIPTMNRPDFLKRILQYYVDTGFQYQIAVGDASDPSSVEQNKAIIGRFKGRLNIRYYFYHGLTVAKTIRRINENITTPYATFIADDDFIVTASVDKCIAFLEENRDFTGTHGQAIVFTLETSGAFGKIKDIGYYRMEELSKNSARERLIGLFDNYFVPLFSIHRLAVWKKMWEYVEPLNNVAFEGEFLPCAIAATRGRIKKLDCLYLVRQDHARRFHPDRFDWITMPTWQGAYQLFRRHVTEDLAECDRIDIEEAEKCFKKAFWSYLKQQFVIEYDENYSKESLKMQMKSVLKRNFLGRSLQSLWRGIKSRFSANGALSSGILNPASRYYEDFKAVQKVVSTSEVSS